MKYVIAFAILISSSYVPAAAQTDTAKIYEEAFDSLQVIVQENRSQCFKQAVFITENAYRLNNMQYDKFNGYVQRLGLIVEAWMQANPLRQYHFSDSADLHKNLGIFKLLKDTVTFLDNDEKLYKLLPYSYDFTDYLGRNDWEYMFVTKLLASHAGNCHSLPYLYKILADEVGATCWLALAPNHTYISNRCKKIGWYNTELTSGTFPIDAWIMASGYLPLKAVQTGIYMDTLSNQQSLALCILDLAKGYEHKTKNYYDGFIIKCCDLTLFYHPLNVQALLLKAETLKRVYEKQLVEKNGMAKNTFAQMEKLYGRLFDLGYREMPEKMYMQWLMSVNKEKDKYTNKKVLEAVSGKR